MQQNIIRNNSIDFYSQTFWFYSKIWERGKVSGRTKEEEKGETPNRMRGKVSGRTKEEKGKL